MDLIKHLLDEDEKVLWMKEIRVIDFLHKKQKRKYNYMKDFYPDKVLKHFTMKEYISNIKE